VGNTDHARRMRNTQGQIGLYKP